MPGLHDQCTWQHIFRCAVQNDHEIGTVHEVGSLENEKSAKEKQIGSHAQSRNGNPKLVCGGLEDQSKGDAACEGKFRCVC